MAATLTVEQEQVSDYPIASLRIHRIQTDCFVISGSRRHLEAIDYDSLFLFFSMYLHHVRVYDRVI